MPIKLHGAAVFRTPHLLNSVIDLPGKAYVAVGGMKVLHAYLFISYSFGMPNLIKAQYVSVDGSQIVKFPRDAVSG